MIQLVPFWENFYLKENVKLDVKLKYFIVSPYQKKEFAFFANIFQRILYLLKILLICLEITEVSLLNNITICSCVNQTVSSLGDTFTSKLKSPSTSFINSYFFSYIRDIFLSSGDIFLYIAVIYVKCCIFVVKNKINIAFSW